MKQRFFWIYSFYFVSLILIAQALANESTTSINVVDNAGGAVQLGDAYILVPEAALSEPVEFSIERLSLEQVPELSKPFEAKSFYQFSSTSASIFNSPVQLIIPVDAPMPSSRAEQVRELYVLDGDELVKMSIGDATSAFIFTVDRLDSITFIAAIANTEDVEAECTSRGGTFNGKYCQLPFPERR
ncbi:MAG: hypothetical protein AAF267_08025 [Deinococcota bacterium]